MKRILTRIAIFTAILVIFIIVYFIVSSKITTVFNITALTERIEFLVVDDNNSSWNFDGVNLINTAGEYIEKNFSGTLTLEKGDQIRIDRFASGPAYISIQNKENKPIGKIRFDEMLNAKVIRNTFLEIEIDSINTKAEKGITHILPIKGFITLGGDVDYEINGEGTGVLKEGEVNMQGFSSRRKNEYFQAGVEALKLGDELTFKKNELAVGFALIGDKPGIEVSYRVEAKEAIIIKTGPVKIGHKISATLLDKFVNDRSFQALSIILGFLIVMSTILTFLMDAYIFYQTYKEK